jgi:hypothetical protein
MRELALDLLSLAVLTLFVAVVGLWAVVLAA